MLAGFNKALHLDRLHLEMNGWEFKNVNFAWTNPLKSRVFKKSRVSSRFGFNATGYYSCMLKDIVKFECNRPDRWSGNSAERRLGKVPLLLQQGSIWIQHWLQSKGAPLISEHLNDFPADEWWAIWGNAVWNAKLNRGVCTNNCCLVFRGYVSLLVVWHDEYRCCLRAFVLQLLRTF